MVVGWFVFGVEEMVVDQVDRRCFLVQWRCKIGLGRMVYQERIRTDQMV